MYYSGKKSISWRFFPLVFSIYFIPSLNSQTCNPPQNLSGEIQHNDVILNWDAPEGESQWIHYDNNEYSNGVGTNDPAVFTVAARFTPELLSEFHEMELTKIKFIPNEINATYMALVFTAEPNNISSVTIVDSTEAVSGDSLVMAQFNTFYLSTPFLIDSTQELWIGYKVVTEDGFPAGHDVGPANQWYGDLILWEGEWVSIGESFGMDYNWLLQGFVEKDTTGSHLSNYIVYRFNDPQDTLGFDQTTFTDENINVDDTTLIYHITGLYENTEQCEESEPSNQTEIDIAFSDPTSFSLISPEDDFEINFSFFDSTDQFYFVWTSSSSPENLDIQYSLQVFYENELVFDTTLNQQSVYLGAVLFADLVMEFDLCWDPVEWNVFAHTEFDTTNSNNGPRVLSLGYFDCEDMGNVQNESKPYKFSLKQNYPNPFNQETSIKYSVDENVKTTLQIYDIGGHVVETLVNDLKSPGLYEVKFDASLHASGVYFAKLIQGEKTAVQKLIYLK